jgi:FtsH-binding integral membrane protein
MSYADAGAWSNDRFVIDAPLDARVAFIRRTYFHLAVAVAAFAGLLAALLTIKAVEDVAASALSFRFSWLFVMGGFMAASYVAQSWAQNATSKTMQYAGLSLYVVAQAIIFVPIMLAARNLEDATGTSIIGPAGLITVVTFAGLSAIVFITKKDFSFMRSFLVAAGWAAMAMVIFAVLFGFDLGILFSGAMVLLACGWILYDTSNVMSHYRTDQDVAASLALFASVALLFWYVLRIVMAFSSRD